MTSSLAIPGSNFLLLRLDEACSVDDVARVLREQFGAQGQALPAAEPSPAPSPGRSLLLVGSTPQSASELARATAAWNCAVTAIAPSDLRERLRTDATDLLLIDSSAVLRPLVADAAIATTLTLSLAEVEERHLRRVLAAWNGNKSRAARSLGIDVKTLYNKLKSWTAREALARRRGAGG